jgi:hypothetical protein
MTKDEALKMCLEYIETDAHERKYVRHAIKEALAQPEQEPVAWLHRFIEGGISIGLKPADLKRHPERWEPLYTYPPQTELVCVCGAVWEGQELVEAPPQRTWVGLNDDDYKVLREGVVKQGKPIAWMIEQIEAKLKEKNT